MSIFARLPSAVIAGFLGTALLTTGGFAAADATTGTPAGTTSTTTVDLGVTCLAPERKLADADIEAFLASPGALLTAFPRGGLPLADRVHALATSSSAVLQPLIDLLPSATAEQKAEIAAGLGQTVIDCNTVQTDYAALIQNKVGALTDQVVLTAFAAALKQERVSAITTTTTNSNGGSIPVGPPSGQFGAGNNFQEGGNQSVVEPGFSFTIGSAGSVSATGTSPTRP